MELHSKIYADGMAPVHGYNVRSEVTSAIMGTNAFKYAYDPIGNRLSASHNSATNIYAANCLNQYTTISNLCDLCVLCGSNNVPFHYDADGNKTSDERGRHYVWNGENSMICASNAEVVVTYAYDHRGRMVLIIVWNTCFRNNSSVGYMPECNNSTSCVLYPRLFSQFYGGSYYTIVKIYYLSCEKCKWKMKSDSKTLFYQYSWNGWRIR